jgi:hypothetical protein
MNALKGKPMKAFIYQDHDAHIAVHTSMMQDPKIMGAIGQNPMAQQIQASLMAHIAEHIGFKYRRDIEKTLGVPLPPPDKPLPEDVEVQLSQLVAQAAAQLLQKDQAELAQQQAQQQAQDPVIQMQQQELQLKAQEIQNKAQREQAELALKAQKQQSDERLNTARVEVEQRRIEIEAQKEAARLQAKDRADEKKITADILKRS